MLIGKKEFDLENNCYIMGILNFTPDSFSDGGKFNNIDSALMHVEQMINDGMDIVDIGGESTRPNYTKISDDEEISRIVPVIEAVKQRFDIPVSLDTYKYKVAEAGIKAGADLINDIWGLKYDDIVSDMQQTIDIALKAGIEKNKIILDVGVGFAKSYENNLEAIDRIDEFRRRLGYPVLLGTSRKSVIGITLDLPSDQRTEGTIATTVAGVMKGVSMVRVHDVKENARAVKMTQAIMKGY